MKLTEKDRNDLLEKAAMLCLNAHRGQVDKVGQAYFQHPMRVAMRCASYAQKIVALLHDVIEDTDMTPAGLLEAGFPQEIVDGVLSVTRRDGESYEAFVVRASRNPIGKVVKLHDLEDNLDLSRLHEIDGRMAERLSRYLAARRFLLGQNPDYAASVENNDSVVNPKPLPSKSEYYRSRRAEINESLRYQLRNKSGQNLNKDRLMVRMPDGKVIAEAAAIDTFAAVLRHFGFENVDGAGILHYGKYPLVSRSNIAGKYKEDTRGWFVLSDCYNKLKAIYINELADRFDSSVIAELTEK